MTDRSMSAKPTPGSKHVLMLGTNVGTVDMVRYLQSLGHRVTVADNLGATHGAKVLADASLDVSTTDTDALVEFGRQHGVDAVLAGVSEFNIRHAITVSESLGTPFYCDRSQWDTFMDKSNFRQLCLDHQVPVPATYFRGEPSGTLSHDDSVSLPCVVKPVDANSLRGISICMSPDQLQPAIDEAAAQSARGSILIEQFVAGQEFTAAYVVVNGTPSLTSLDVRLPFAFPDMTTSFPILRVYPPSFADDYMNECHPSVKTMIRASGLTNACVFVQGIRSAAGFAVFEAGLRMAGEAPYRFLDAVNGVNPMKHLVDSVLSDSPTYDVARDDVYMGGYVCAIASFVLRPGIVGSITDVAAAVTDLPQVLEWESRYTAGDEVPEDATLRRIGVRFILRCVDTEELGRILTVLNERVDVKDPAGNSMAVKPSPELALAV